MATEGWMGGVSPGTFAGHSMPCPYEENPRSMVSAATFWEEFAAPERETVAPARELAERAMVAAA